MLINLGAVALVAFALGLIAFGVYEFARTRNWRALLPAGIAVVLLAVFFFFASRFGAMLFGAPLFAVDLPEFARGTLTVLGIGILAGALAAALAYVARRRAW